MIRDFSEEKREELYGALDRIDDKEWKPFMAWCGGRADEFGDWADRLGISSYMEPLDNYQNRILETNESTREQIDIVFENVAEVDQRYAEIFRGYQETVKEQIAQVQALTEAMRTAGRTGVDKGRVFFEREEDALSDREKKILSGQEILKRRLEGEGISSSECKKICDMITENNPEMLINLYVTDCNSGADADKVYSIIKEYYEAHKNDEELDYAERVLDSYLQAEGYINSVEREFMIEMIREEYPNVLLSLYTTNNYSSSSNDAVVRTAINYYESNKSNIELEAIEKKFRDDENTKQYAIVCEYLEFLETLQYICRAEREQFVSSIKKGNDISIEKKEEICEFMLERNELIKELGQSEIMGNGVEDGNWTREQIMCALQIEGELTALGYDEEFIAGLIGNMKKEGEFGVLEGTNLEGFPYWEHINNCINYHNTYSGKNIMDYDLIQLYVDMVWQRYEGECSNSDLHYFGIGAIQWTDKRGEELLELYLKEAGYDTESPEFLEIVQSCRKGDAYKKVYLTDDQVRNAEMEMMIYELTENSAYMKVYLTYESSRGNDTSQNIKGATETIMEDYIKPGTDTYLEREAAAFRWYEVRYRK